MVSKARLDFPLPLGPVTTVNFSSGRSRSKPLRLFWRAPRTSTQACSLDVVTPFFPSLLKATDDNRCAGKKRKRLCSNEPGPGMLEARQNRADESLLFWPDDFVQLGHQGLMGFCVVVVAPDREFEH